MPSIRLSAGWCHTRVTSGQAESISHSLSIVNSGRACKPDSVRRRSAHGALQTAAIIPLGPGSHRDSSSLPEGFQLKLACANMKSERVHLHERRSLSRASSPLLFGLAPRGVFRALAIASEAVGSYPTFSPLPNDASIAKTSRRFPCAMPPCCAPPAVCFLWHYP